MRSSERGKASGAGPPQPSFDRDGLATSFVSPSPDWMNRWGKKSASSRDEAKKTPLRFMQADSRLRSNHIAFVNAGTSTNHDKVESTETTFRTPASSNNPSGPPSISAGLGLTDLNCRPAVNFTSQFNMIPESEQKTCSQSPSASDRFSIDLRGSANRVDTGFPMPTVRRSPSPEGSVSSEEVILFSGRGGSNCGAEKPIVWSWPSNDPVTISDPSAKVNEAPRDKHSTPVTSRKVSPILHKAAPSIDRFGGDDCQMRGRQVPFTVKRPTRKRHGKKQRKVDQDAVLADYIANVAADGNFDGLALDDTHGVPQVDAIDTDCWQDEPDGPEALPRAESITSLSMTWESADLEAFDELSTSHEVLAAEVKRIVSKRKRPSGIQYLVVPEGYTVDDARWYPMASLGGFTACQKIRAFENEQAQLETISTATDPDSFSDNDVELEQDLQDEMDDLADEQDLLDRHRERMTDEHIARLFLKQEELGLASHDLVLFDGVEQQSPSDHVAQRPRRNPEPGNVSQSRRKAKNRFQDEFPSATLLADVLEQDPYHGFDIMGQDRPSLRRKVKGRRGRIPLELSDSEIEQTLQSQWEKDRDKKKARKEDRETLRAQGLIGRKGKANPKAKHPGNISLVEIKDQIRDFLESANENLALPSMPDKDRRLVHELANTFKLTSKSFGKGNDRFPVLYRTRRTLAFDEGLLSRKQLRLFLGKPLPPRARVSKERSVTAGVARGGGFAKAGVSYRDGDIVGAAAPELGQENRGRAMLEKMGWSTGTALGALNNKGIMQPVAHIVKNSKAGLG